MQCGDCDKFGVVCDRARTAGTICDKFVDRRAVITDAVGAQGTGMKFDSGKLLAGILLRQFSVQLEDISAVLTFGAKKYSEGSWQNVPDAKKRYEDAFMRHLLAIGRGETHDEESGLSHRAHAATNLLFLMHFDRHPQQPKTIQPTVRC